MGEQYFMAFFSYLDQMQYMNDEQFGRVFRAAMVYAQSGKMPEMDPMEMTAFMFIKWNIDKTNEKKAQTSEARSKAASAKWSKANANDCTTMQTDAKDMQADANGCKAMQTDAKGMQADASAMQTDANDHMKKKKEEEKEDKKNTVPNGTVQEEAEEDGTVPFAKIRSLYNKLCPSFKPCRGMEGERRRYVAGRWATYPSLETFETVFRNAEASDFLKGKNNRNWTATFDWLMRPTNFQKVLEGNYENKDSPPEEDRDPLLAYLDKVINGEVEVQDSFGMGGVNSDERRDSSDYQSSQDGIPEFLQQVQSG